MKVLALNAGSNSLKFEIVETDPKDSDRSTSPFGRKVVSGAYDNIGKDNGTFTVFEGKKASQQETRDVPTYQHAAGLLIDWLDEGGATEQGVGGLSAIESIGHRIVHGGHLFQTPARIDAGVIRQIEELEDLAPLHNASALHVIRAVQERAGPGMPMVAVFDTLFHQTIPEVAALYPLPPEISKRHHIRRYGFHGISHQYLLLRYSQITKRPIRELNLITLHLEGGSSAAAIRNGQSVDTSMGFTPLEGLMMGTRSGDIDPALVPYLMRKEKLDEKGIESFLNKECGLLGVSGISSDTRELGKHSDDEKVALAVDMFCYRVRKYVGAYMAALGRVDAIIFGGGIGENTPSVRERICQGLEVLGVSFSPGYNNELVDREGVFSSPDSRVQLWVIPTEEALMVAHHTAGFLDRRKP